ncbi:hypothetical protein AAIG97_32520, partial [Pseudomonas aeruginosa]|uniref:hypothetical protein n=1 Tax=Pseudomonas aeruginosa TaxID=287 RepID=UPI0031B7BE7F
PPPSGSFPDITHPSANTSRSSEKRLKELGAAGLVKLGDGGVQVIFGGKSQILRDEIKTVMSRPRPTEMTVACAN